MTSDQGANRQPAACCSAPTEQDHSFAVVRLLQPVMYLQGIRVEAGCLLKLPAVRAACFVEWRAAEYAPDPGPPYYPDAVTGRFLRDLTDEEMAKLLVRNVTRNQDPDYPQEETVREGFDLGFSGAMPATPASPEDIATLRAFIERMSLSNRLEDIRQNLASITNTPEHEEAVTLLEDAKRLCHQASDSTNACDVRLQAGDSACALLNQFAGVVRAGLRRNELRQGRADFRAARSEGGKARAQNRCDELAMRDNGILRDRERLLSGGTNRHELAGKLAAKHHLDASTIRRILKKAGVS